MGSPSGAIFDELARGYRIASGDGTEPARGYDVVIYDGRSLTSEQIGSLPATDSFLSSGKMLIVLDPTREDREALQDHLGATSLIDDSPALAVFNTYSEDRLLQSTDLVEFPATLAADALQTDPPGPATGAAIDAAVAADAQLEERRLGRRAAEWRAQYEGRRAEAAASLGTLSGISSARFASAIAAAERGEVVPPPLDAGTHAGLTTWLSPPIGIASAPGSQFLTVQPFQVTRSYALALHSIYYQDRFQAVYPKAVVGDNVDCRGPFGICCFLPINARFDLPPAQTTYTNVNTSVQTYRILARNEGAYSHEVIAHQLITSVPTLTPTPPASPRIGSETISFCTNRGPVGGPYYCGPDVNGCNAFEQKYDASSQRGFNEQIVSAFTWDADTAPRITLDGWVPKAANDVVSASSSQSYDKTVSWSVQGGLCAGICEINNNVGVSLGGNYGSNERWSWSQGTTINMGAWQMVSPGPVDPLFPARSIFDFRASVGPNNLANLQALSLPPSTPQSPALSFAVGLPLGLSDLQAQGLTVRNESNWSTRFKGPLLPARVATLKVANTFNYGEVYELYTLAPGLPAGTRQYGALHTYTPPEIGIQLDFAQAILQLPQSPDWTIAVRMEATAVDGFFPVRGTVTLDRISDADTTLYLGAQLEPSGTTFVPKPSVIQELPTRVVIPKGEASATFGARAQSGLAVQRAVVRLPGARQAGRVRHDDPGPLRRPAGIQAVVPWRDE